MSLISTAWAWCGIIPWVNMVSAALWSAVAGAELDDMPMPPLPMPGMVLVGVLPEVPAQPARAMAAEMPKAEIVAEMVRVFFMGSSPSIIKSALWHACG